MDRVNATDSRINALLARFQQFSETEEEKSDSDSESNFDYNQNIDELLEQMRIQDDADEFELESPAHC